MKSPALVSILLALAMLANVPVSYAMETDQYNLPPVPLADIGDEVSQYVEKNFVEAVDKVNAEIAEHQKCIDSLHTRPADCGSASDEAKQLAYLRSDEAVAYEVFKRLGDGSLVITKTGKWFVDHQFAGTPAKFKAPYSESPYMFMPIDYATMSPTVNIYGADLGTDKVEHFFQQGYKYFTIRGSELKNGKTEAAAEHKAVKWGRFTENTYFGLMVSGVYSNADLYANYAGMKFYESLTHPLLVGDKTRPALLSLDNGRWEITDAANLKEHLIKPFIGNGLNEALNPSVYAFNVYPTVHRVVKNYSCSEWRKAFPDATRKTFEKLSAPLETWHGEDYGWSKRSLMVTIGETCFAPSAS